MTSDQDIRRAAQAAIQEYGDGAGLHAARRADECLAEGDMDDRADWHRIERAIDAVLKIDPALGGGAPAPTARRDTSSGWPTEKTCLPLKTGFRM